MTDPRPAAPALAPLLLRLSALDARLDDVAAASAQRDELKGEIVALFREADQTLRACAALKESVKELVARWKALPAADESDDGPSPPAEPDSAGVARTLPRPFATPAQPLELGLSGPAGAAGHAAGGPPPGAFSGAPTGSATARVDHLGASTYLAKGWTALAAGDATRAEDALERALALAPGDIEATALLGWALAAQGRDADALATLTALIERAPACALARVSMGFAQIQRGSYGEAIEQLAKAMRAEDDRRAALYAHFYLGVVYQRREMYDDAVTFFRRALALGPNLLEAYHEMGRAQWLGGDRTAAVEAWRAGAAASKFNPWGKRCEAMRAVAEEGGDPLAA